MELEEGVLIVRGRSIWPLFGYLYNVGIVGVGFAREVEEIHQRISVLLGRVEVMMILVG